ncbi:MAG: TIGR01777 family oxidoreductase, partial [Acidobacteriota bacterium]
GLIGKKLCRRLAEAGHVVTILSRRAGTEFTTFIWEPQASAPPPEAIEGVDAIIHLAGEPVAGRWSPEVKKSIRNSRVLGTQNLVAGIAAATLKPKALISASAVGLYGDRGDELLDEGAGRGSGFLSDVCVEWENEGRRAKELGVRVAHVRVGVVLAAEGGALPAMLPAFKFGLAASLGDGRQWFPWIHIEDILGIFLHALNNESITEPLNAASPGIVRNEEFTRELAQALHRPAFLSAPSFALNLILGEMAEMVLASQRVVPGRTLDTGYQFRYPALAPALRDLVG